MSVKVSNIDKFYGEQKALDDVSFEIGTGEVVGFLGPNGAGKSTMMKIICCFIPQTSGKVTVHGHDNIEESIAVRSKVGYLPEHNPLYYDMYVREYLAFTASIHKRMRSVSDRIRNMIELTGLGPEQHKKIGALSKGYRQRVGLAQALIHDPEVLILDEPTTGLDPNQLVEIRSLISEIGKQKTVILSTHIMQEVEAICNRVIIINQGKIVADDNTSVLQQSLAANLTLQVEFEAAIPADEIRKLSGVRSVSEVSGNTYLIECTDDQEASSLIMKWSVENKHTIRQLKKGDNSLETVFRSLTRD